MLAATISTVSTTEQYRISGDMANCFSQVTIAIVRVTSSTEEFDKLDKT